MPSTYDRALVAFAKSKPGSWVVLNILTRVDRWLIPASNGRLSTGIGSRLHRSALVLTTTGAKSGLERQTPLLYFRRGDDLVVIASRAGHAKHPAWYHNLTKTPEATVQIGSERIAVVARRAEGREREDLWRSAVELYSGYDTYRERTEREIPVMVLEPAGERP